MSDFHPEHLRSIENMQVSDPRWASFGRVNVRGEIEPITLEQYAKPIQEIKLNCSVPESIATHFETAKNLALYAWHVYRFTPVAELYAYISIELALRSKTGDTKQPFKKLLKKAIEDGVLSNERFSQWKRVTEHRKYRYQENIELAQYFDQAIPEPPEYWNYLDILVENIPNFRNTYAHGSTSISPWASAALEDSAEIINQLYANEI